VGLLGAVIEDLGAWGAVARASGEHDLLFPRTDGDVFRSHLAGHKLWAVQGLATAGLTSTHRWKAEA